MQLDLILENTENTVVAEYKPNTDRQEKYQSEADLEKSFIKQLTNQAYEYVNINNEDDLIKNLRLQLEKLNNYTFSNNEWENFFNSVIANRSYNIEDKTEIIQKNHIQTLTCDNGEKKNIYLINKKNIHSNILQVINQYEATGERNNRYDVTILVNGLPLIHIELKRRGVDLKEAFNQINRYQRDSFWAGSGLFEYIQIFVISNGTYTKYYSNTTRETHIKEVNNMNKPSRKTSNSFEFTSWWADASNKSITDLIDFTKTFFAKHTILNIITKYCVFTVDKILLVMRPYQIVATESILNKIQLSYNYKKYGTIEGGGYIWHTTGSGKTLTSFKTAQLVSELGYIDKVLFVVDRKDLDYQTMKEYDKFQKGSANSNTNTAILKAQLENNNEDKKVIITTIQKLSCFIKKNKENDVYNKHFVIIFDECHRSQFGEMHKTIIKAFKKYYLFGFTGTPIFAKNSNISNNNINNNSNNYYTTEQIFGKKLHTYTIIDAIKDKNVLPFKVYYHSTMQEAENIDDERVKDIDRKKALESPERVKKIVEYILNNFDRMTLRNDKGYFFKTLSNVEEIAKMKNKRDIKEDRKEIITKGFNSIFAVASIPMAKSYYLEFKRQMEENPTKRLKIATIYSFGVNDDSNSYDDMIDENPEDTSKLDKSSRDFLESAIKDYNEIFKTNYDTSSEKFQNYYKDVSLRVKNREIDILIVVNMFLTGFDATTLNTLWIDKNLHSHGLLQAFSRTNRILNSVKQYGNIICFRNLEKETEKSIALFGDKTACGIALLKKFEDYYNGYKDDDGKNVSGYKDLIEELKNKYKVGTMIYENEAQKDFVSLFGSILKLRNILFLFDEFKDKEILSDYDFQDYQSEYLRIYDILRKKNTADSQNINDDITFEIELIKQIEINIDYILILIKKYHQENTKDKDIVVIQKLINSSPELRSKKDLIEKFINSLTLSSDVDTDWEKFVKKNKQEELDKLIEEENLNMKKTYEFVKTSFKNGYMQSSGSEFAKILPPLSLFDKNNIRGNKKSIVFDKLLKLFDRYKNI